MELYGVRSRKPTKGLNAKKEVPQDSLEIGPRASFLVIYINEWMTSVTFEKHAPGSDAPGTGLITKRHPDWFGATPTSLHDTVCSNSPVST